MEKYESQLVELINNVRDYGCKTSKLAAETILNNHPELEDDYRLLLDCAIEQ